MNKFLKILGALIVVLAAAFWWLLIQGKAPKTSTGEFDLAHYRTLVAEASDGRPQTIHIETIGSDLTPGFAADSGNFSMEYTSAYTAFQLVWPDGTIVIGGAVDEATVLEMAMNGDGNFDSAAYHRLLSGLSNANQIWLTHEHIDHVMAITRHPNPASIAPQLKLNADQLRGLPQFAINGELAPEIANITPTEITAPQLVAPGVVVDRTPGHTPGSQSMFVMTQDGTEYLFIGDIVWNMINLDSLKTRPRLLQYMLFDPNEDRKAVLRQVRELHDMRDDNPKLVIVPAHHGEYLDGLVRTGKLTRGFAER